MNLEINKNQISMVQGTNNFSKKNGLTFLGIFCINAIDHSCKKDLGY
jgi:hypothetical protein